LVEDLRAERAELATAVGDGATFARARDLAAWLGLDPVRLQAPELLPGDGNPVVFLYCNRCHN